MQWVFYFSLNLDLTCPISLLSLHFGLHMCLILIILSYARHFSRPHTPFSPRPLCFMYSCMFSQTLSHPATSIFLSSLLLSLIKPIATQCVSVCASWSINCWVVWRRMPRLTTTCLITSIKPCWSVSQTNSPMWGFRLRWPWHACNNQRILTAQPSMVTFCFVFNFFVFFSFIKYKYSQLISCF